MSRPNRVVQLLLSAMALSAAAPAPGYAMSFLVAPTRVACGGAQRSVSVTVMNRDTRDHTFRLSLENRRIAPDGALLPMEDALLADRTATDLVRLSTRQMALGPQGSGIVRVLCRVPDSAETGEYRSHLVIQQLPDQDPATTPDVAPDGVSVSITPVYGVSIPVLVRAGVTSARASLLSAELVRPDLVRLLMAGEGNRSAFLNVRVMPASRRATTPIFEARGVPLYFPLSQRSFEAPLTAEQQAAVARGARVEWQQVDEAGAPLGPASEMTLRAPSE